MFEVGMGFLRNYCDGEVDKGEITSIRDNANGETIVDVSFDDGTKNSYTENCVIANLGKRIIVTEGVMW
jgi:hypothetical protein